MNGWGLVLVLALVNLILADGIVWFAIAQGGPSVTRVTPAPGAHGYEGAGCPPS